MTCAPMKLDLKKSHRQELDEQVFHFCVIVELQQPENSNPPIPPEIELSYAMAMRRLPVIGTEASANTNKPKMADDPATEMSLSN
jgi:hypothetical protein